VEPIQPGLDFLEVVHETVGTCDALIGGCDQ
jgi:hypothetical protein